MSYCLVWTILFAYYYLARELDAAKAMRMVLERLARAGRELASQESDLEVATRQYLQLIYESQVRLPFRWLGGVHLEE